jgi:nitric oxide synthase oxygenase domain/subunit
MPHEAGGPRIINNQLIRFAGFRDKNGKIIGDPAEAEFTSWCQSNGWDEKPSPFEVGLTFKNYPPNRI